MNMVERIMTEGVCMAEIKLSCARRIIDHVAAHERGECKKWGSKGHFHPWTDEVDVEHARVLMTEAHDACTCGEH